MFSKKIKIILMFLLFYQSPLLSKSNNLNDFDSGNISKYFSGIVAFENKDNSNALNYFNSSKILLNRHDPYLEKLVLSLVLENKVTQAINNIKLNIGKTNSDFFEAYLLLALDSLKKNNLDDAVEILSKVPEFLQKDRYNYIILNSLKQYLHVFNEKEILNSAKSLLKSKKLKSVLIETSISKKKNIIKLLKKNNFIIKDSHLLKDSNEVNLIFAKK